MSMHWRISTMDKFASGLRYALLGATMMIGSAGLGLAQPTPTGNSAQKSGIEGKVAQYSLTPRGKLILTDGTEVFLPPHASTALVFAVRPGDTVTIHRPEAGISPTAAGRTASNTASPGSITLGPTDKSSG
jgi:hypothetical protein